MIARPEYDWETDPSAVIEGPAGITSPNGTVYIVYSANTCNGPQYALGALRLTSGADPMLASSWSKLPEPLLTTNTTAGEYGPGHNGFFKSPDGTQDWIVYHANRNENGSCDAYRETFVQQVTWTNDTPVLEPVVAPGVEIIPPSGEVEDLL
jgi:GH43 family beta-xylosidase